MKTLKMWRSRLICCLFASVPYAAQAQSSPPEAETDPSSEPDSATSTDQQFHVEYRIVGFTSMTTTGAISTQLPTGDTLHGYAAADELCAADVHESARMARSSEQVASEVDLQIAWIRPSQLLVAPNPDAEGVAERKWFAVDAGANTMVAGSSPDNAIGNMTCLSQTAKDSIHGGQVIDLSRQIRLLVCTNRLQVACSAPVRVPLAP